MINYQRVYAFDVDETLKIGPHPGPIDVSELKKLMEKGNIVGLCGNHRVAMQSWPSWYAVISFFGGYPPIGSYKPKFLQEIKASIYEANKKITDYIMVGNTREDARAGLVLPSSQDDAYARLAGWRFIKESDFAAGQR